MGMAAAAHRQSRPGAPPDGYELEAAEMSTLLSRLIKPQAAILGLTLVALAALPFSLRLAAPDAALSLLLPVAWIGAIAGMLAAGPRWRGTRAAPLLVVGGLFILLIRVGEMTEAVLNSGWQTVRL